MKNTITLKSNKQAVYLMNAIYMFIERSQANAETAPDWLREIEENEINTIKPLLDQLRQINIPEE